MARKKSETIEPKATEPEPAKTEQDHQTEPSKIAKRTIKDSVFTNLFGDKKYLIQLYRSLHPEDKEVTEEQLTDITIRNVLTDNLYNDLGFMVRNKLVILVEAQSTWTVNIIVRALLYLIQTYHDYLERTKQNLYKSKKVTLPEPELYVIYTGDRKTKPASISLSKEFFDGKEICLDVKVNMIYDGKEGDIVNQYVLFTRICREQIALYGRSQKAILETIRICKDRDVLKEYLESKMSEVVDIMMLLYDEEEIMRSYVESEIYEAEKRAEKRGEKRGEKRAEKRAEEKEYNNKLKLAKQLLEDGTLPIEKIVLFTELPLETIQKLAESLQPA